MKDKFKNFFLKNRSASQTVAKNTFWLFAGEIFAKTFRAAIVIYAARALGVGSYGVFSYAITLASFFTIFSDIGLNAILNRETVRQPELREKYASTTLFIKLFLILIGIGLIFGFAPALTKIQGVGFLLPGVAALFIFDSLREFGYSLNRAMEKMEREAFNRFFTNFSIAGLGLYFLIVAPSPKTLMAAYAIGSGLGALIIIWTLREYFKNLFLNFTAKLVWPIFSAAWPFALMGLLSVIMINTDTIMLGWLKTAADIGLYSAAQRPVQLLYIIPTLISAASFPALARLAQRDNKRFREAFEKIIVFILLFALPITLIGLIFGKEIMGLLFGQSYLPATLAFQLLMITVLISFPATFISNGIFAYDKQKYFIWLLGLGALGNILFNYLLIPTYGIAGSAAATIVAQLLAYGFMWLKMKRINQFTILPRLKLIILSSFIMAVGAGLALSLGLNFWLSLALSGSFYLLPLAILKEPILKEAKLIILEKN